MKKTLLIIIAAMFIMTISIQAQVLQVQQNATKTYTTSAAGGSTVTGYVWSLSGGSSTFANSGAASQSVTWDVIGAGNVLSVIPVSDHTCNGEAQSVTVDVVAVLSRTLTASASPSLCPLTTNGGDYVSSNLTLSGAAPLADWTFNYTVDALPAVHPSPALTGLTPTATLTDRFANASNTVNGSHTINIVSYTVDGTTYTPALPIQIAVTVYPTPAINTISSN